MALHTARPTWFWPVLVLTVLLLTVQLIVYAFSVDSERDEFGSSEGVAESSETGGSEGSYELGAENILSQAWNDEEELPSFGIPDVPSSVRVDSAPDSLPVVLADEPPPGVSTQDLEHPFNNDEPGRKAYYLAPWNALIDYLTDGFASQLSAVIDSANSEFTAGSQLSGSFLNMKNNLLAFVYSVDWKEPVFLFLAPFYGCIFTVILYSREKFFLQGFILVSISGLMYAAERIDTYLFENHKLVTKQNYFGPNSPFIAFVWCAPLLIAALTLVCRIIVDTFVLLVRLKRLQLRKQTKASQQPKASLKPETSHESSTEASGPQEGEIQPSKTDMPADGAKISSISPRLTKRVHAANANFDEVTGEKANRYNLRTRLVA